jgi:hypothetical protein
MHQFFLGRVLEYLDIDCACVPVLDEQGVKQKRRDFVSKFAISHREPFPTRY